MANEINNLAEFRALEEEVDTAYRAAYSTSHPGYLPGPEAQWFARPIPAPCLAWNGGVTGKWEAVSDPPAAYHDACPYSLDSNWTPHVDDDLGVWYDPPADWLTVEWPAADSPAFYTTWPPHIWESYQAWVVQPASNGYFGWVTVWLASYTRVPDPAVMREWPINGQYVSWLRWHIWQADDMVYQAGPPAANDPPTHWFTICNACGFVGMNQAISAVASIGDGLTRVTVGSTAGIFPGTRIGIEGFQYGTITEPFAVIDGMWTLMDTCNELHVEYTVVAVPDGTHFDVAFDSSGITDAYTSGAAKARKYGWRDAHARAPLKIVDAWSSGTDTVLSLAYEVVSPEWGREPILFEDQSVTLSGCGAGDWASLNDTFTIKSVSGNEVTIELDSSGFDDHYGRSSGRLMASGWPEDAPIWLYRKDAKGFAATSMLGEWVFADIRAAIAAL